MVEKSSRKTDEAARACDQRGEMQNPRCITSVEQELDHVFCLTNPDKAQYRCLYCEQEYARK